MYNTTIAEYLKASKDSSVKMTNHFFPGTLTNPNVLLRVTDDSVLNPYDGILDKYRKEYTMNDNEYKIYKYNPWRVALDVYGSTEYWFLVLHSNELYSANQFDMRTVSMYTTDVLQVIQEILAIEDRHMREETGKTNAYVKDIEFQLQSARNKIYNTHVVKTYSY